MSDFVREGFKEIIKNNEYNNISLRIINDRKREGIKNVIDHTKKTKQNISIKIPFNHLNNNLTVRKKISSTVLSTNPSNGRLNKIIVNKNIIMNKMPSTNLKKKNKNLKELKYYGSSTNIQKGSLQKNHFIYISKKQNYSISNNEKNQTEINNYNIQTMPATKLSRNNINNTNELYKNMKSPQSKNNSIVNSIGDINQNNNNKKTNFIYNSNTYRDPNIKNTALKKYNCLTYNVRKDKNKNEENQRNNNMFFNNTLTSITEAKAGNLISQRIKRKDLENFKNTKMVNITTSSKEEKFFFNPKKHNSFISEIPRNPLVRYGSKDSLLEKINPKKNVNIIKLTNINSNNQNFNNIIKIPNSLNKDNNIDNNTANNTTKINQNIIYTKNEEKKKISRDIMTRINNRTYLKNCGDKNNKNNTISILHRTNIRDIINKSMDYKEIKTPKINEQNIAFIRKDFSLKKKNKEKENKEYNDDKIKEEKEEESSNKSIKEEDDLKHENNSQKYKKKDENGNKILFINKRLISDFSNHSSNKDLTTNTKKEYIHPRHKEPLDSIRKDKGNRIQKKLFVQKNPQKKVEVNNINIQNINNSNEIKKENTETKRISKLTDIKNLNPQITKRIKHLIMSKKINAIKPMTNISFTAKKPFKNYFNTETLDTKDISVDSELKPKKLNQYNFKDINRRLINSLSVKNNLRKHILNRKNFFNKNLKKYQYNDDEETINKDRTKTAKKLNNYTYLELKDIKNSKRDTFITLHSIGGVYNDSRFDDMEHSSSLTHMDFKFKEFKPYTALHPNKKFKKRGLSHFRTNSERKIRGIKIVGNTDSIKYQYDKLNLSSLKKNSIFGKSMRNISLKKIEEKKWLKKDDSTKSLN